MTLRDFLYLDRPLVRDFLAQAEGGLIDEAKERQSTTGKGGVGGKVGAGPVSIGGEKARENTFETETVVRQVAASEFDRLYTFLEDDGLVVVEEADEGSAIAEIRRKQFVEVDARVRVSGLYQFSTLAQTFGSLVPMFETLDSDVTIDKKTRQTVEGIAAIAGMETTIPVIATVAGLLNFKVGLELNPEHALTDTWDIDASILLKVQRVIKEGDRLVVGNPLGGMLKLAPPEKQEELFKSFQTEEARKLGIAGDFAIYAPGVIGVPVAIYR